MAAVRSPGSAELHDVLLLEFLVALRIVHRILCDELPIMNRRELERAVAEVSSGHPAAAAVRTIIDDTTAAMGIMTATSASL